MNRKAYIAGFTLIELIIVLSIITLTLFFTLPVLKNIRIFSNAGSESQKLLFLIEKLKKESFYENRNMAMHFDLPEQRFWITKESTKMQRKEVQGEKAENKAMNSKTILSQIRIMEIIRDSGDRSAEESDIIIRFNHRGYSDRAAIHLMDENDAEFTIIIEPFLLKPGIKEGSISFQDCI